MVQKQFNNYYVTYYSHYNANVVATIYCSMDGKSVGAVSFAHNNLAIPAPIVGTGPLAGNLYIWYSQNEFDTIMNLLRYDKKPLTLFINTDPNLNYGGITTSTDLVGEALPK